MFYRAALIQSNEKQKLISRKLPSLKDGELMIRVAGCFICGSDLKNIKYGSKRISKDRIMGHEVSGKIIEVASNVKIFKVGEYVTIGADFPCMKCANCTVSKYDNCTNHMAIGHERDGGFADYIILPSEFVKHGPIVKIPKAFSLKLAALAEPVACCLRGFKDHFFPRNAKKFCIYGAGPIGALISIIIRIKFPQANIIVVDPNSDRRKLFKKFNMSNHCIASSDSSPTIKEQDVIFVACSVIDAQKNALNYVRPGGTVCIFGGLPANMNELTLDPNLVHYKELCIYGTTGSSKADLEKAVNLIFENKESFERVITKEYELSKIDDALRMAQSGRELKIFINCEI